MAVVTKKFGEFLMKIGDAYDAFECGFKSKNFEITADTTKTLVPSCTDPDAAAWPSTQVTGLSASASCSGIVDAQTSYEQMRAWIMSGLPKAAKIYPVGASGGYYTGNWVATKFGNAASHGEKTTFDFSLESDGEITWVPAA